MSFSVIELVRRHRWILIWGVCLCLCYVLIPYLYTFFHVQQSQAWVPINDQYHYCSDDKFYAAVVQESRQSFLSFRNPVSSEVGTYWIDILRVTSTKLAAILGFFLPSQRISYPLSFALSVALNYVSIFCLGVVLGFNSIVSGIVAWLGVFALNGFVPEYGWNNLIEYLWNAHSQAWFDTVNDDFRYVVLSVAILFAWWSLSCLSGLREKRSYLYVSIFSVALACSAYSYISVAMACALMTAIYGILLLIEKNWQLAGKLAQVCLGTGVILAISGFPAHLRKFMEANSLVVLGSHLDHQAAHLSVGAAFLSLVANRYFLAPLTLSGICRAQPVLRRLLLSCSMSTVIIKTLDLLPQTSGLGDRIIVRGWSSVWLVLCLYGLSFGLKSLAIMVQLRWKRFLRWRRAAIVLVMALLTVVPLVGSIRMAKALQRSQSYVIAKDQWETYSFIAENLPDKAKVLAVDLADLQLLPVYTSADLVVSGISYGSSTPEIELNKYIQTLKLIGIPMSLMQNWLEMMAITAPRFRCAPTLLRPKWEEMEGALLLEHLIYYPNVNQFKGRPIRAENGAELSRDFKLLIPQLLSQPLERDRLIDETDYLLISSRFAARRRDPNADILGFSPVYKNGWHTLYKRTRTN